MLKYVGLPTLTSVAEPVLNQGHNYYTIESTLRRIHTETPGTTNHTTNSQPVGIQSSGQESRWPRAARAAVQKIAHHVNNCGSIEV